MQLKSLEMHGFKSFPDKTKIEFDRGLTAVVGPNGSGKSNIGDAVKWVLGEQSTKELRGKKMDDVIFGGTQKRKPMSFAQVTLNLDNAKRDLPYDTDIVSITRKLYKTGDSEYMINGQNVRLKDIHELFMDTGLGKDGYSIIGQGKIDAIVGAKSTERREIFEEAAGISKFRYKRQEAQRRLASAEENILRLKDITSELEERIGPLKNQSEKAAVFLRLSEEKKELDISLSVNKLNSHKEKLLKLEEDISQNQDSENQIEKQLSDIEQKFLDITQKRQECSVKIEEARAIATESRQFAAESAADITVLKNDIKHNDINIEKIKNQQEDLTKSHREFDEKIADNKIKIAAILEQNRVLEDELAEKTEELSAAAGENSEFDKSTQALNAELGRLYVLRSEYSISAASAEETVKTSKERIADISDRLSRQASELEGLLAEKKKYDSQRDDIEEKLSENRNKLAGYSKLLADKQESLQKSQEQFDLLISRINAIKQKITVLNDVERNMDGYVYSVRELIKASNVGRISGIHGTVGQLIDADGENALAIETALGGAMQNVVVDNEETAKRGIYYLKENKLGRATFLPLTSVKGSTFTEKSLENYAGYIGMAHELVTYDARYDGIIKSLLGRIVIVDDINTATVIAKKNGYRFKIVTLDGQVVNAGGSFTGGSTVKNAGVLTRKNELARLEKDMKTLSDKKDKLSSVLEDVKAGRDKLSIETEGAREEINRLEVEKAKIAGEQSRIEAITAQVNAKNEEQKSEIERLSKLISDSEASKRENLAKASETERLIAEKNEELTSSDSHRLAIVERSEKLSAEIYELKLRQAENAKDIESLTEQNGELLLRKESLDLSGGKYSEEIREILADTDEKEKAIKELEVRIESANRKTNEYTDKINELQSERMALERTSNELHEEEKELTRHKQVFSNEAVKLTERRETMQRDYDSVISMLWEDYHLTRSEAVELAKPVENIQEAVAEQTRLRQKIRALGNVNVSAIEEYKEVSERYEFMSAQLEDVLKSKSELEGIISDLTVKICEKFKTSFEIINENFKEIFVELFGGGKGELVLTEPDNLLETGIDIEVTPPGKVIKNLSALSGGEKAFVAVAIYFSILKYSPSPFCILDEIEAALDEVNVAKYAQYLRMFTKTTQFILITHRRPTMEEADILYGVTMQEKGVSKLLKMNAGEAAGLN